MRDLIIIVLLMITIVAATLIWFVAAMLLPARVCLVALALFVAVLFYALMTWLWSD